MGKSIKTICIISPHNLCEVIIFTVAIKRIFVATKYIPLIYLLAVLVVKSGKLADGAGITIVGWGCINEPQIINNLVIGYNGVISDIIALHPFSSGFRFTSENYLSFHHSISLD